MIRIPLEEAGLWSQIRDLVPNWDNLTADRRWNRLKPLFIDAQHHKCAFCECEIGGWGSAEGERDTQTQDVEHFRPKNEVKHWPIPAGWSIPFPLEIGPSKGYPWLSHEPLNYLVSCIPCNRSNKKSYFPVRIALDDYTSEPAVSELGKEKPYLVFPVATVADADPEELIAFLGSKPVPHPDLEPTSFEYWRAMVTIKVLNLDRPDLDRPRRELVVRMALEFSLSSRIRDVVPREIVDRYCESNKPFSSCAKCYRALCLDFPAMARDLAVVLAEELGEPECVQRILKEWRV